jgi:hypothetical protein
MDTFLRLVFILSAVLTTGGIAIIVILAPKPIVFLDHLRGVSRYAIIMGSAFGGVACLYGWVPPWHSTSLILGIAIAMAVYARGQHMAALEEEQATAHPIRHFLYLAWLLITGKLRTGSKQ